MTREILRSKEDAIKLSLRCGINQDSYAGIDIVQNMDYALQEAVKNDQEPCESDSLISEATEREFAITE